MSTKTTRIVAVIAAVLLSVLIWIVATVADVAVEAPLGAGGDVQEISVWMVILTAGFASLAAWGLLALLERFTGKARQIWAIVAAVVFVISLAGPLTAPDIAGSTRVILLLMHLAVAGVLFSMFLRGTRVAVGTAS